MKNDQVKPIIKHMQRPISEDKIRQGAMPNASKEQVMKSKHTGGGCVDPKCGC